MPRKRQHAPQGPPIVRPRSHPAGSGLTYAGSPGHAEYDLPGLPEGFCWTYGELFAPGQTAIAYLEASQRVRDCDCD
jgi:hypothetical protein